MTDLNTSYDTTALGAKAYFYCVYSFSLQSYLNETVILYFARSYFCGRAWFCIRVI